MNDNQTKLMALLQNDQTLYKTIFEKSTPEEGYAAAKAVVEALTPTDFEGCVQELRAKGGALSDQQLEAAAGGLHWSGGPMGLI